MFYLLGLTLVILFFFQRQLQRCCPKGALVFFVCGGLHIHFTGMRLCPVYKCHFSVNLATADSIFRFGPYTTARQVLSLSADARGSITNLAQRQCRDLVISVPHTACLKRMRGALAHTWRGSHASLACLCGLPGVPQRTSGVPRNHSCVALVLTRPCSIKCIPGVCNKLGAALPDTWRASGMYLAFWPTPGLSSSAGLASLRSTWHAPRDHAGAVLVLRWPCSKTSLVQLYIRPGAALPDTKHASSTRLALWPQPGAKDASQSSYTLK